MELCDFYISDDIINIIYNNLYIIDKINFTIVNKYMLTNYYNKTQMYHLDFFLNNDYIKFYNLLNKYDYEKEDLGYLKKVCIESVECIREMRLEHLEIISDLRYIFELLFNFNIINDYLVKECNIKFYNQQFKNLNDSIIKNDRNKTINNINNINKTRPRLCLIKDFGKGDSKFINFCNCNTRRRYVNNLLVYSLEHTCNYHQTKQKWIPLIS
mgnify:CR=1 FL=1